MIKEKHVHHFTEPIVKHVAVRRYVIEHGKPVADIITGKDTLKQRQCACGAIETYDSERKIA